MLNPSYYFSIGLHGIVFRSSYNVKMLKKTNSKQWRHTLVNEIHKLITKMYVLRKPGNFAPTKHKFISGHCFTFQEVGILEGFSQEVLSVNQSLWFVLLLSVKPKPYQSPKPISVFSAVLDYLNCGHTSTY